MRPAPNGTLAVPIRVTGNDRVGVIVAQDDRRAVLSIPWRCPYCGTGPCRSTPRTTVGGDVGRFAHIHPEAGIPARRRSITRLWDELETVEEH